MSKENEVAKREYGLPAQYVGKDGLPIGTEGISPDDLLIPSLAIIQKMSKTSDKGLGCFINSVTEDVYETLTVVPLLVQKGRVKFVKGKLDSPPECKSNDGIKSVDGKLCEGCEHAQWSKDNDGNSVKPACADQRNFLVLLPDNNSVAILSFKRTAMPVAKQLMTIIALKHTPFFFYEVTFVTKKIEGSTGIYYIPEIAGKLIETSNETRNIALGWVKKLAKKGIDVHYETEE